MGVVESANEHAIAYADAEAIVATSDDAVVVANEYALAVADVEDIKADNPPPAPEPPAQEGQAPPEPAAP